MPIFLVIIWRYFSVTQRAEESEPGDATQAKLDLLVAEVASLRETMTSQQTATLSDNTRSGRTNVSAYLSDDSDELRNAESSRRAASGTSLTPAEELAKVETREARRKELAELRKELAELRARMEEL